MRPEGCSIIAVGMIGAIGAGKSYVARALCQRYNWTYLSSDDYLPPKGRSSYTDFDRVHATAQRIAAEYQCVKTGQSFVVDTASRVPIARRELVDTVRAWVAGTPNLTCSVVGVWVHAPLRVCRMRNERRADPVPDHVVREYHAALESHPPDIDEDGWDMLIEIPNPTNKPIDVSQWMRL